MVMNNLNRIRNTGINCITAAIIWILAIGKCNIRVDSQTKDGYRMPQQLLSDFNKLALVYDRELNRLSSQIAMLPFQLYIQASVNIRIDHGI